MADQSPVDVFVSLGSNIRPAENLRIACDDLHREYGELSLSNVYQTPAVGFDGEDFLNMVVGFRTCEEPQQLLNHFEVMHENAERVRTENPNSPRTLDVDLLLYGGLI